MISRSNKAATQFVLIKGGAHEGDPCYSGIHMYHTANQEVARVVDGFLVDHREAGAAAAR